MKTKTKSFQLPSAKPVDVEYRLRRALEATVDISMFVKSIDPAALPEGKQAELLNRVLDMAKSILEAQEMAPKKKCRKAKETPATAKDSQ